MSEGQLRAHAARRRCSTITRPERRNAVDDETAAELLDGFHRFEADDEARALVLTGEGPEAFCAGADLKAFAEKAQAFSGDDPDGGDGSRAGWLDQRPDGPLGFTRLRASKPTIAAISGWCLAGGLELALWCDLRVATESARLGFTERRFGVPLIDGGTQRLPRIVGIGRALEMILTGRVIEAAEALEWGLVTEVVAAGGQLERALEIAEGLAAFPQTTMLSDRRAALEGIGLPFEEGLALEAEIGRDSVITGAPRARRGSPPARAAAPRARGSSGRAWPPRPSGPDPEPGQQPLLGLALDLGDDLDVSGQRRAAELGRQQVVDLEDPGGVVHRDLDPHRRARSPAAISTRSIAAAEIEWMPILPASTGAGCARGPCRARRRRGPHRPRPCRARRGGGGR